MEPYVPKKLPLDYNLSSEMLNLLCSATEAYGEYKGYLKSMEYDYKYFLESMLTNDLFYTFKIDSAKIEKDEMFYAQFKVKSDVFTQFINLKRMLLIGLTESNNTGFTVDIFNKLHKVLFCDCKKNSLTKGSGKFRKKQTYLLKPGLAGSSVSFVPPVYGNVPSSIKNLCDYMNKNIDESFIAAAITHFQIERIHPYISGNGKLGRIFIPIQLSYYKKEPPILFLSEAIDNLKNTYFTILSTESDVDHETFIKFFLECIIDQCSLNIKKIKKLNKIYKQDYESFKTKIGGSTIYKVYPIIVKKIVFTVNDIITETELHINSVNKVLNKLVDAGYLVKEKKKGTNRVTFTYTNMHEVFIK